MKKSRITFMTATLVSTLLTLIIPWSFGISFKLTSDLHGISMDGKVTGWLSMDGADMGYWSKERTIIKELFNFSHISTIMMELTVCIFVFALILGTLSIVSFILFKKDSALIKIFDFINLAVLAVYFLLVILYTASAVTFVKDYANFLGATAGQGKISYTGNLAGAGIFGILLYWIMGAGMTGWATFIVIRSVKK